MHQGRIISKDSEEFARIHQIKSKNELLIQKLNTQIHQPDDVRRILSEVTQQSISNSTEINVPFETDYGQHINFGKDCFLNKNAMFVDLGGITLGDRCLIGPNVTLISVNHMSEVSNRRSLKLAPITIQNDVWLGANVTVLPGVTIGEGAIVGANSLVTTDIPPMTISVGTPAKVIKSISD